MAGSASARAQVIVLRLRAAGEPPTMEGHAAPGDYKDVILFLVTAGVIVPLFRRWKLNPILGFLVGGILLGPQGLGGLGRAGPR